MDDGILQDFTARVGVTTSEGGNNNVVKYIADDNAATYHDEGTSVAASAADDAKAGAWMALAPMMPDTGTRPCTAVMADGRTPTQGA